MKGPALFMDLAGPSALRLATSLRSRGLKVLNAGPAIGSIPGWDADLAGPIEGRARVQLDRLLEDLPPAISDPRSVQAFKTALGNPLALNSQPVLQRIVELAALELAALERFDRFVANKRPAIIVLGCDNNHAQRITIARARQLEIPSLQIAHGIYGSHPHLSYAANMDLLHADHVAVAGSRAREHMLRFANKKERIHLTGAMQWDELYQPEIRIDASAARLGMGLDPDRPLVLITLGYAEGASAFYRAMTERYHEIHQAIGRAVHRLPARFQVAVRPHPLEFSRITDDRRRQATTKAYVDHLSTICGRPVALSTGPLPRDIVAADVVASTGASSVIAIAMILGRPALDIPCFAADVPIYLGSDGVMVIEDDADLGPALTMMAVEGPARERALAAQQRGLPEINHGHDGAATERVADLVRDLAAVVVNSAPPLASVALDRREPAELVPAPKAAAGEQREVLILGGASSLARRRSEDDGRALAAAGIDPEIRLKDRPVIHVYGAPSGAEEIEALRRARRGPRRVIWSPVGVDGGAAARAEKIREHLEVHGHDEERLALLHSCLAAGGLECEEPRDRRFEGLVAELIELADVLVFPCDEEARRFLRRHPAPDAELAICPLGFELSDVDLRIDPGGAILVPGAAGDWATLAALKGLKAQVRKIDDLVTKPGEPIRASLLALPADAAIESRFLALAASGLPIVADVDSPAFDYLGPRIRLVRFTDVAALRARLAARLLDAEAPRRSGKSSEDFALAPAGRALIEAYLLSSGRESPRSRGH